MTDHSPAFPSGPADPATTPGCVTASIDPMGPPPSVPEEVLRARVYLMRVGEPQTSSAVTVARMVAECGPVETAARIRAGGLPDGSAVHLPAHRLQDRVDADLDAARTVGARPLVPEDPAWPTESFRGFGIGDAASLTAPLGLWVRGSGPGRLLGPAAVSVLGSRAATGYGCHVAAEIGSALADVEVAVVAGAGFGIDAAAARGVLAAGGRTVAVLACGIDRAYPVAHASLIDRIAATGLIVSEYPPGAVPARHRFLARHRLIAALGYQACVVVEAGARSRSLAAAADAAALDRPVLAVPGPVTSAMSAGCHELIRGGAELLASPSQLIDVVGPVDSGGSGGGRTG